MNHFHRRGKGQRLLRISSADPAEFQRQHGTQPLSPGQETVVGGFKNGLLGLFPKGSVDGCQVALNCLPINTGLFLKFHR